jgi:hypothetical protein
MMDTPYWETLVDVLEVSPAVKRMLRNKKGINRTDVSCLSGLDAQNHPPTNPPTQHLLQVRVALGKHRAELILRLLGLKGCADTIVGNAKIRGVRCVHVKNPTHIRRHSQRNASMASSIPGDVDLYSPPRSDHAL